MKSGLLFFMKQKYKILYNLANYVNFLYVVLYGKTIEELQLLTNSNVTKNEKVIFQVNFLLFLCNLMFRGLLLHEFLQKKIQIHYYSNCTYILQKIWNNNANKLSAFCEYTQSIKIVRNEALFNYGHEYSIARSIKKVFRTFLKILEVRFSFNTSITTVVSF